MALIFKIYQFPDLMKIIGVIMTYNCAEFVQHAINQIPKEEFDDILCTDDGSTDDTIEVIKKNNIKYIITSEKLDLLPCLDLKNVGVINLSVARRNFLVKKNTSKSYIFKVDNKC